MKYLTLLLASLLLAACESDADKCPPINTDMYGPWMPYGAADSLYVPFGNDSIPFVVASAEDVYEPDANSGVMLSPLCNKYWTFEMTSKDHQLSFGLYENDFTQAFFTVNGKTLAFNRFAKDTLIGNKIREKVAVFSGDNDSSGIHNIVLEYGSGLIALGIK